MNQNTVTADTPKQNQITEGVIWKQLLLFFFPILFGTLFSSFAILPMQSLWAGSWEKKRRQQLEALLTGLSSGAGPIPWEPCKRSRKTAGS